MIELPPIDITPAQWQIVKDILQKQVPQYEVWAFGSRVKMAAGPYSDLDLAIISKEPLPLMISAALNEAFSESDLPWKVDVVDWANTSPSFRALIEQEKITLQIAL